MKKLQDIFTDRKSREDFKDKVEVVMAAIVLTGFVYKKIKARNNPVYDITSLEEKA